MTKPPIFIVGPGGVGTYLAAKLSAKRPVQLIGRESRPNAKVSLSGASYHDELDLPVFSWTEVGTLPKNSLVFVCTKAFQLEGALDDLRAHSEDTESLSVYLFQNGLGVYDEASRWLPDVQFGRAICKFGAALDRYRFPAVLSIVGAEGGIEVAGGSQPQELVDLFIDSGIPSLSRPSITEIEWKKAIWNSSLNGLCALLGAPNGIVLRDPDIQTAFRGLMEEAALVAGAEGIFFTSSDFEAMTQATEAVADNMNSMLQDMQARRPTEVGWLNGAILQRANQQGLEVPRNQLIYSMIRYFEKTYPSDAGKD